MVDEQRDNLERHITTWTTTVSGLERKPPYHDLLLQLLD
jgi:hypothetical protein